MFTRLRNLFTKNRISDVTPQSKPAYQVDPTPANDPQSLPTSVISEVRVMPRDPLHGVILPPRGRRSAPMPVSRPTVTTNTDRPFHSESSHSHVSDSIPIYTSHHSSFNHSSSSESCNSDSGSSSSDSSCSSSSD